MLSIIKSFYHGLCNSTKSQLRTEKDIRSNLKEKQIDHMIDDSFPASDAPSTY